MAVDKKFYRVAWVEVAKAQKPEQLVCELVCRTFSEALDKVEELTKNASVSITEVVALTPKSITPAQQMLLDAAIYKQWEK